MLKCTNASMALMLSIIPRVLRVLVWLRGNAGYYPGRLIYIYRVMREGGRKLCRAWGLKMRGRLSGKPGIEIRRS